MKIIKLTSSKATLTQDSLKVVKKTDKELKFTMNPNGRWNESSWVLSTTTKLMGKVKCTDKMAPGRKGNS